MRPNPTESLDAEVAVRAEQHGSQQRERHSLGGGVFGLAVLLSPGMLGDQHAPGDGQAHPEGDEKKHHREREADGRKRVRAEPTDPVRIREVVRRLEEISDDDWERQIKQRSGDIAGREVELVPSFEYAIPGRALKRPSFCRRLTL